MKKLIFTLFVLTSMPVFSENRDITLSELKISAAKVAKIAKLDQQFNIEDVKVYFMEGASSLDVMPYDVSSVLVISQKNLGLENLPFSIRFYNRIGVKFRTNGTPPEIRLFAQDEYSNIYPAIDNFVVTFDPKLSCSKVAESFLGNELKNCYQFGVAIIKVNPERLLEIANDSWIQEINAEKEVYNVPFEFSPAIEISNESNLSVDKYRTFTEQLRKEGNITPSVTEIML